MVRTWSSTRTGTVGRAAGAGSVATRGQSAAGTRRTDIDPGYGVNLTVDGKRISDQAIVQKNGSKAVAYVWSDEEVETVFDENGVGRIVPRTPGNEVVAEMVQVTEEQGGRLVGLDRMTGVPQTWVISDSDKRCRGCSA